MNVHSKFHRSNRSVETWLKIIMASRKYVPATALSTTGIMTLRSGMFLIVLYGSLAFTLNLQSCKETNKQPAGIFKLLDPAQSNVHFSNNITETDSLNILDYLYFYNGGGVASADFNNDGLEDLYFVSNQESNQLYLNKGDLKFEEITKSSGTAGKGNWKTGVTIADINNDGHKDIYLSVVSGYKGFSGKNQLYINNGDLTFSEKAAEYGLDFAGLSTQASFFDYDKDGDLDMFLLTHSVHSNSSYGDSSLRFKYNEAAGDHLFRNDSNHFVDVTEKAGIYASAIGYGLGLSIADFNNDGWDDIYISNDFFEQDYYYINQQDGTFKERVKEAFGHTSLFSMGNVAGDINKDGNLDLISTDMLPDDIKALKSTVNDRPLDVYNLEVKNGFHYQYSRNSLQLNVANGKKFIDVGLYSGISATDWTWSPLMQDFDMDGHKDLFFSNGIKKRLNDLDYLKYLGDPDIQRHENGRQFDVNKIDKMPDGRVPNLLFRGDSTLKFQDISPANAMNQASASSGAVYVDLDNDGDLEIVTNNMDQPAFIYLNTRIQKGIEDKPAYLNYSVKFKDSNRDGIGTKLFMRSAAGNMDHQEVQTSSGFQSSQSTQLLFTFSASDRPEELLIIWPDNSYQIVKQFDMGSRKHLLWDSTLVNPAATAIAPVIENFIKGSAQADHQMMEAELLADVKIIQTPDFNYYSLLPHTYLKHTPPIAKADINGDGFDDLYVGGVAGEERYLLIGNADGKFNKINVTAFEPYLAYTDAEASWADLDNDGKPDLIVTNAEHPFVNPAQIKPHRVFLNKGNFSFEAFALPGLKSLTSHLALLDYDGDGFKDIFLAGAVNFKDYNKVLPSFLLLNRGQGNFLSASKKAFEDLTDIGFISELTVSDLNKDGRDDLVISAEWQPVQVFLNDGATLKKLSLPILDKLSGWWQSATVADLDEDGEADLLLGNWGLNNKYNVGAGRPLYAYNSDLDKDGKADLVLSYFYKGSYYPFRPKNDLEQELPYMKKEWLSYQKMADKTTKEIFKDRINEKDRLESNTFESVFISNILHARTSTALPFLYQQSPIISTATADASNRLIVNGNFWGAIPYEGKYDGLGLAMIEYNKETRQFLKPCYWVNSLFNFSQIDYISKINDAKQDRWIVMTGEGKLLTVSTGDNKTLLVKKTDFNKRDNKSL